jgi:hypothetical protein
MCLNNYQDGIRAKNKSFPNRTSIVMINLESATYLVKVIQNNQELKTFKIIKK